LRPSNSALFNRENNIVDPNVDVVQPKVFLDPLWDRWRGGEKLAPIFFGVAQKTFEELFFRALLETHLVEALN
jgi:hypothetical protein